VLIVAVPHPRVAPPPTPATAAMVGAATTAPTTSHAPIAVLRTALVAAA